MSIDQRIRDGLRATNDHLPAPDISTALAAVTTGRPTARRHLLALAAAAVVVLIVGVLAVTRDAHDSKEPIGPVAPTPTGTRAPKALGPGIYFDALPVDGDSLSAPAHQIGGPKDIYLTREGGTAQQLVATGANEHCPMVSPDGDMLAYLEGTTLVLRRLDANGLPGATTSRVQHSTARTDDPACPQWSRDGRRLAVATIGPEGTLEVRVIEPDGTERRLSTPEASGAYAWSPDGEAIAYTTFDSVWVAPLDGGERSRLWRGRTSGRSGVGPWPGHPQQVAWLTTGELAVSTQTDVDGEYAQHLVDAVSGHDQVIGTFPMDSGWGWSWSPDGSLLAFADTDGTERLLDRISGRTVRIRPRLLGHVLSIWKLVWSPDGRRLVGTAGNPDPSADLGFGLVSMDPDGGSVKVLTPWTLALYAEADASWSPR